MNFQDHSQLIHGIMQYSLKNIRLEAMLRDAAGSGLGGGVYLLDCYMGRQIRTEYSHAITTRTATDSNTFVMEVYE